MRSLILAAMTAALIAVPATALAATGDGDFPTTTSTDCNVHPDAVNCIPGPDPDDLPHPIDEPEVPEPSGPGEPTLVDRVCTTRVNTTGATVLGLTTTLIQCPGGSSAGGFTQAKLDMLRGEPPCNQRNDVIRIHYPWARGVTFTSPELGECVRAGVVVFSRQFI
jgi:hypothetical protein